MFKGFSSTIYLIFSREITELSVLLLLDVSVTYTKDRYTRTHEKIVLKLINVPTQVNENNHIFPKKVFFIFFHVCYIKLI